jgi:hypothetical protein
MKAWIGKLLKRWHWGFRHAYSRWERRLFPNGDGV